MDSLSPCPARFERGFLAQRGANPGIALETLCKLDITNNNIQIVKQKSPQPGG